MPRLVKLYDGYPAIVDDADYESVRVYSWHRTTTGYAMNDQAGLMHRFLMKPPDDVRLDHRNGDGCDNRRGNLRHATTAQNMHNRGKTKANQSGYKGVVWSDHRGKWLAQVDAHSRRCRLGAYDTAESASAAYREAARRLHGEFYRAAPAQSERPAIYDKIISDGLARLDEIDAMREALEHEAESIRREASLAMRWKTDRLARESGMSVDRFFHTYLLCETADDRSAPPADRPRRGVLPPKYANPDDTSVVWSGKGPLPRWFSAALDRGLSREDMEIDRQASEPRAGEES
jgi:DNA-binding protein H-NS